MVRQPPKRLAEAVPVNRQCGRGRASNSKQKQPLSQDWGCFIL